MAEAKTANDAAAGQAGSGALEIDTLHKWYGDFHVLRGISLTVRRGEKIVICGPSGSGKSTLIRCVNGLEKFDSGSITVEGQALTADLRQLAKIRSEVGMVLKATIPCSV